VCEFPKSDSEALLLDIDLFISAISSVMFKHHRIWNGKCYECFIRAIEEVVVGYFVDINSSMFGEKLRKHSE
jgi:hypothetical protein